MLRIGRVQPYLNVCRVEMEGLVLMEEDRILSNTSRVCPVCRNVKMDPKHLLKHGVEILEVCGLFGGINTKVEKERRRREVLTLLGGVV